MFLFHYFKNLYSLLNSVFFFFFQYHCHFLLALFLEDIDQICFGVKFSGNKVSSQHSLQQLKS